MVFLRHFLTGGYLWLFQFALAVHRHFREPLLAAKTHAEVGPSLLAPTAVILPGPHGTMTHSLAVPHAGGVVHHNRKEDRMKNATVLGWGGD